MLHELIHLAQMLGSFYIAVLTLLLTANSEAQAMLPAGTYCFFNGMLWMEGACVQRVTGL